MNTDLREAAETLVAIWEAPRVKMGVIDEAFDALRAALAATPPEPLDQPALWCTHCGEGTIPGLCRNKDQKAPYCYAALRSDPVAATPAAWVTPMRYGSQVTFYKPTKPLSWDDEDGAWYCIPLYAAPVAAIPASGDAAPKSSGHQVDAASPLHAAAKPTVTPSGGQDAFDAWRQS